MARDFDGAASRYLGTGSDTPAIDISGTQFSIFCWLNPTTVDANDRVLVGKSQYISQDVQYNIGHNNNNVWFEIGDASSTDIISTTPAGAVRPGIWTATCGVLDGTTMRIMGNDKINSKTIARSIQNTGFNLFFGIRSGAGGPEHLGLIAHVAIWGAGLKHDEMYRLCVLHESPLSIRPEQLRGYWPMETYPGERDYGKTGVNLGMTGTVPPRPGPDIEYIPTFARMTEITMPIYSAIQLFSGGVVSG